MEDFKNVFLICSAPPPFLVHLSFLGWYNPSYEPFPPQCDTEVKEHKIKYEQLEDKISQRLKWAAGANPNTRLILEKFEEAIVARKAALGKL